MRIEDIELGEKYYHTCEGCKYSCQSVEHVNCKTKIISVGDEMVVHKREGRREISCPASQFTPIEAKEEKVEWKAGDKARIHFTSENPAATESHAKWEGKIVTLASYISSMRIWEIVEPAPGTDGCTLCFRDSWLEKVSDKGDEKSQAAETFPGGFKVGDRIRIKHNEYTTERFRGKTGTVVSRQVWKTLGRHLSPVGIPLRLDELIENTSSGEMDNFHSTDISDVLEHIKEEVTPMRASDALPDSKAERHQLDEITEVLVDAVLQPGVYFYPSSHGMYKNGYSDYKILVGKHLPGNARVTVEEEIGTGIRIDVTAYGVRDFDGGHEVSLNEPGDYHYPENSDSYAIRVHVLLAQETHVMLGVRRFNRKVKDHSGNGLDGTMEPARRAEIKATVFPFQITDDEVLRRASFPDDTTFEADVRSAHDVSCNQKRKVCLLCGALISAKDWRHELSIECARKRDPRHLPELPRMRHFTGDEE